MTGRRYGVENAAAKQFIPVINVSGIRTRQIPELDIPVLPGAACHDVPNPDVFHPRRRSALHVIAEAKAICDSCPVKQACLEWCLEWERKNREIQGGIWGGRTEWERAAESGLKGRRFCRSGRHEMVGDNIAVTSAGGVRCRACRNEADAASKRRIRGVEKIGA